MAAPVESHARDQYWLFVEIATKTCLAARGGLAAAQAGTTWPGTWPSAREVKGLPVLRNHFLYCTLVIPFYLMRWGPGTF